MKASSQIHRELVSALIAHNFPVRAEVKPRLAKEIRASNRAKAQSKVGKATKSDLCTQGGGQFPMRGYTRMGRDRLHVWDL